MTTAAVVALGAVVYGFMLAEARRASQNEARQRTRGGREPAGDVYALMQVAYPGVFLAMLIEARVRGADAAAAPVFGLIVFTAAKALKWWAITTLGDFWTFRVIVVPGTTAVRAGPYRLVRHPNYVGVVGEIVGAAFACGAVVTGPLALLVFGALLVRRMQIENRALDAILPPH
jgi:methyltransferase